MFYETFDVVRGFTTVETAYRATKKYTQTLGFIGGSYASFMAQSPRIRPDYIVVMPNDIDIFATSNDNQKLIIENLEASGYVFQSGSEHVANLAHESEMSVQVIQPKPAWMDVDTTDGDFVCNLLNDFDLACSRAVLINPGRVYADKDIHYTQSKILRINDPLRTLKRVMKYHKRGVEFHDAELFKILRAWDAVSDERKKQIYDDNQPCDEDADYDYDAWFEEDDWFEGE